MSNDNKQPLEDDAILGGIEGLELKEDRIKIATLKQALN